jgi:hypothetical protein
VLAYETMQGLYESGSKPAGAAALDRIARENHGRRYHRRADVVTSVDSEQGRYLYRGIDAALYSCTGGRLAPKGTGPFEHVFRYDGTITYDGSATYGPSEQNAVLRHELRQEGFPTAGISTTPVFERACFYATAGGTKARGFVVKIDRELLRAHGIREYVVREWIPSPSVPEDMEIILVAPDFGSLPSEVVVELVEVVA